ncbi:polysaccharide pyruvyl transferase family protein [uncultured Adlercreutzia sp.]|uniref:polysaccharide pyruvyl transferase family protein n=1 Tax=uncultured Adlercreutzia sp. TaxID=875803 RepID=UPI0026F406A4|nr:polysaccharide pyruvyl transferase family protein [uncultured Adlercreutzia sp.]
MTRYGLYGIAGVYNFGCEAIVRGIAKTLKDCDAGCEIVYFSPNYAYDSARLRDLDIEVREIGAADPLPKKVLRKGLSWLGAERRPLRIDIADLVRDIDVLVSIGGDIYTLPSHDLAQRTYPYYNHLIDVCDRVIDKGIPVVLYGASVGPFGSYEKAVDYYRRALGRYAAILCRERGSLSYLGQLGLADNVAFLPDPAFSVQAQDASTHELAGQIGVNLSPLSFRQLIGDGRKEAAVAAATELVEGVLANFSEDVLFVPHVLSPNENDNDEAFLRRVYDRLKEPDRARVRFADTSQGFLGVKAQLLQCSFLVTARMHCAINALHEGVPTLLLSYSQKSQGMCEYVYGSREWVVPLQSGSEAILRKMKLMEERAPELREQLTARMEAIGEESAALAAELFAEGRFVDTMGT